MDTIIIRKFIWIGVNAEGLQEIGELKGASLLEAIIQELISDEICIYWGKGCCEDNSTIDEQAKQILWHIEESYVDGSSSNQVSVVDITDHDNPIILFPIDMRPANFEIDIIGLKYIIKAWIPAECEDPQIYESMESATSDLTQLQEMQPENRYEIHDANSKDD